MILLAGFASLLRFQLNSGELNIQRPKKDTSCLTNLRNRKYLYLLSMTGMLTGQIMTLLANKDCFNLVYQMQSCQLLTAF